MSKRINREPTNPVRTCGECYHESACFYAMGGCGSLRRADATHCTNFETLTQILEKYAGVFGYTRKEKDNAEIH